MRQCLDWLLGSLAASVILVTAPAPAEPTLAEEAAFKAAVANVAMAVVRIEPLALTAAANASPIEAAPGSGPSTGTVIAPGLVLTTSFTIPDDVGSGVIVLPNGDRRAARVRARDRSRGLVLLAVDGLPEAPSLEAVPRKGVRPGQWAIAVGRGWSAASPNVAVGIISARNRAWGRGVQTDAAISPVNYGGPLIDIAGRVIGILAPLPAEPAGMTEGTELYDAGIGFAVPLEDVLEVLPRLADGESLDAGILGIAYRSRDQITGVPAIASVRQGSPAARDGILPGDRIIAIDGVPTPRIADARHATGPKRAGDTIAVTLERGVSGGKSIRIETTTTLVSELPPWRRAVIGVVTNSEGEGIERSPVRVAWVLPGSPADHAGIVAGDTIESITTGAVDAVPIEGRASAAGVLAGVAPGDHVTLAVRHEASVKTLEVETVAMPGTVPPEGPILQAPAADPLTGPLDSTELVRLSTADVADPAIAVVPRGNGPVGVLVWAGTPHGKVTDADAVPWKAAAARHGIAVVLVGSADKAAWSRDDLATVTRALASLHARRPIDPSMIGIAGSGAGAAFAWMTAETLGHAACGVALVNATLPRRAEIRPAEPGTGWWVLLGAGSDAAGRDRIVLDGNRLEKAGFPVGTLPQTDADTPPADLLCRWASMLGLL